MPDFDDIARRNQAAWGNDVKQGGQYTAPWLDLKRELLEDYIAGKFEYLPEPHAYIYPREILQDVQGKDVLCLASGGGQQTVVYGLLGAKVTSFDLTEGQLNADRQAALHHGYEITTIQGDMRDLSALANESFDIVYQAISLCFVPNVREVYREVARVLRPGGCYRVGHLNPATQLVEEDSRTGEKYLIGEPYCGGKLEEVEGYDFDEFRHLFTDIFNGLTEAGLTILGVWEDPRHLQHNLDAKPGTNVHLLTRVQDFFSVLAQKSA